MLQVIRKLLLKVVNDIDTGNTELSDKEMMEIVDVLKRYNFRDKFISKYQAYTYLNLRRAQFDNLVREGIIPRGQKAEGFKELQWSLKDIKQIANERRNTKTPSGEQHNA